MARGDALPIGDEVTRWVKPKLLGKDDDGQVILDGNGCPSRVFPEAFELREDEDSLSVTWLQFFGQNRADHLPAAAEATRVSMESQTLQPKGAFVVAGVEPVLAAGRDYGIKLRILEEAVEGNDAHAEIRRYPRELGLLQIALARDVFSERHLYARIREEGWTP